MRLLVCGDRGWRDRERIAQVLRLIAFTVERAIDEFDGYKEADLPAITLVHGAARGADTIAAEEGVKLGFEIKAYPAEWESFGRAAGPIRNQLMLDDGRPDLVLAFHSNLAESKGTRDMVGRARRAGIPVEVIK